MVNVKIHGTNGEGEHGTQNLSLEKATEYLNLLKSVDSFIIGNEHLQYAGNYLEAHTQVSDGLILNIYTKGI